MNFVEPIRDPEMVRSMEHYFEEQSERNHMMFLVGIYTGRRISDILRIRISDVKNRNTINIREKKTGKQAAIEINPILKKALKEYCKDKDPNEYLIKSRKNTNKPLNRSTAYRILNKAAKEFGLENIGNHTLRKTFGYHFYKKYKDVATLMEIFNHSDPSVTLRYIGINQETVNQAIKYFKIY